VGSIFYGAAPYGWPSSAALDGPMMKATADVTQCDGDAIGIDELPTHDLSGSEKSAMPPALKVVIVVVALNLLIAVMILIKLKVVHLG
jgi:hypothetical protein